METKAKQETELSVKFEGDKTTNGDYIKALIKYFSDYGVCNAFILEQALKGIQEINKKVDEYKKSLIDKV